ncbi:MAG: YbjN domain-containing protein [Rhizobiales bacterium]|nr:YbjN domain-containing protein [Hyphomicrobiales bacterium]
MARLHRYSLNFSAGFADLPDSATPRRQTSRRHSSNPIEVIAGIANRNAWPLHCAGDDELALAVEGKCDDYQVFFTWLSDLEVFHLACVFEMRVPEERRPEVQRLIACINEQLWLGHFDLWMEDGTVVFRQSLLLVGGATATARQCEVMLGAALDACERYHPAFAFVMAAENAGNALEATLFETAGEA